MRLLYIPSVRLDDFLLLPTGRVVPLKKKESVIHTTFVYKDTDGFQLSYSNVDTLQTSDVFSAKEREKNTSFHVGILFLFLVDFSGPL